MTARSTRQPFSNALSTRIEQGVGVEVLAPDGFAGTEFKAKRVIDNRNKG